MKTTALTTAILVACLCGAGPASACFRSVAASQPTPRDGGFLARDMAAPTVAGAIALELSRGLSPREALARVRGGR